jgi:predicted alpha/beta superfamily hydrolase
VIKRPQTAFASGSIWFRTAAITKATFSASKYNRRIETKMMMKTEREKEKNEKIVPRGDGK